MSPVDEVKRLLDACDAAERTEVLRYLRDDLGACLHPLERQLHARAEVILEAIHRAGGLTLRMIRGVIAEAAFGVEVVDRLGNWRSRPVSGDPAYDFLLDDGIGEVRVQVKLLRSRGGAPWATTDGPRVFRGLPADTYLVETQKTRGGRNKQTGAATRPYRYGEFDLLAVATYPLTDRWDTFLYTPAAWLAPDPKNGGLIFKYQPVASAANADWAGDFSTAVGWLRSGQTRTIHVQ